MKKTELQIQRILEIISDQPGISSTKIAEILGVSRISVYMYLQKLLAHNEIRTEGRRKSTRYFPSMKPFFRQSISAYRMTSEEIEVLQQNIIAELLEKYDEEVLWEDVAATFEIYCLYIAPDDTVFTGFQAFILWCIDKKHNFSESIVEKAIEYLDIVGAIEFRRNKKNGFLNGTLSAKENLKDAVEIAFDQFYFCMLSVLENGFGSTRVYLELLYGKKNGNAFFLEEAVRQFLDPIQRFLDTERVDAYIMTPPTMGRNIQFRDVLERQLSLKIQKIHAEKTPLVGKILREQKAIHDKNERIRNASQSLVVTIPHDVAQYGHIVIFDDSFTTGATPNAIALKLRNAGFTGKITIITICGSYNYHLTLTEEEI